MSEDTVPVSVMILDKEYRIACKGDEREALLETSRFLDSKMREIRASGKVIGTDRIAVMAALNLAHELLQQKTQKEYGSAAVSRRILTIREKVESALQQNGQLEL